MKIPSVIYHGNSFNLVSFGLFAALGSMAGFSVSFFYLNVMGIPIVDYIWPFLYYILFGNLLFAKLFLIFSVGRKLFFQNLIKHLNETSFYQHGGFIGFILATLLLYYLLKIPFFLLSDSVCLGALVTMFTGRLGCYYYGCCVGKPTKSRFGITYTDPEVKICRDRPEFAGNRLIPVQLIASGYDLLLFIICCLTLFFLPRTGLITLILFFGINLKRIVVQPFRWKDPASRISYQWVAFALILVILLICIYFSISGELLFAEEKILVPITFMNFISFTSSDPEILLSLFMAGTINFIAYGIHGKKLGTHFNLKRC